MLTAIAALGCLSHAGMARAQGNLSDLLVDLIQSDIFLAPPQTGISHEAHFIVGSDQKQAPALFNQQLIAQLATVPVGSSSGSFSYTFDPSAGTFTRATDSFGPSLAERAFTNGKGKFTFGGNFQHSTYSSFEGADLQTGDLRFYLRHQDVGGSFVQGDLIEARLKLKLSSNTTTFFGSVGLTDNWDVAVAIPIVRISMDADVEARVLRLATGATATTHVFPNGTDRSTFSNSASASGLADVQVRTKYRFANLNGGGLAANLDIRVPTGKTEDLLGSGAAAATFSLIGSSVRGPVAPHFNIGFTASGSGDIVKVSNEFVYRVGSEFILSPRFTTSVEFLGRSLVDAGRLEYSDTTWLYTNAAGITNSFQLRELEATDKALNLNSFAFGGKYNLQGNLLFSANLLVAATSNGLTARVTPILGLEYAF